jgi:hypothetical protein
VQGIYAHGNTLATLHLPAYVPPACLPHQPAAAMAEETQIIVKFVTKLASPLKVPENDLVLSGRHTTGVLPNLPMLLAAGGPSQAEAIWPVSSHQSPFSARFASHSLFLHERRCETRGVLAENPRPFDFIIDGVLLRASLEQHLVEKGISPVR